VDVDLIIQVSDSLTTLWSFIQALT